MIPIRNKRKTLQATVDEIRIFALAYVDKYAPSKQQLRTYLLKKYLKLSVPNIKKQDVTNLIDVVLSDLEKSKFINDKFYSESKAKSMIRRGSSINKIRNYLIGKGIKDQFIKDTVNKILVAFPLIIIYLIGPLGVFIYWLIRIFYAKSINLYE